MAYNEELCKNEHRRIDVRLDKGDNRMDQHESTLNNHELRICKTEDVTRLQGTVFWRFFDRALSVLSGVITALILAWIMSTR